MNFIVYIYSILWTHLLCLIDKATRPNPATGHLHPHHRNRLKLSKFKLKNLSQEILVITQMTPPICIIILVPKMDKDRTFLSLKKNYGTSPEKQLEMNQTKRIPMFTLDGPQVIYPIQMPQVASRRTWATRAYFLVCALMEKTRSSLTLTMLQRFQINHFQ
jgi:hypothetical protein